MSEFKPAETRPAEDPEPDWFDLSLSRATWRPLGLLAAFWQMSRENVIATLIRAVQYREWPEGDVMTDPAAFQEWCLRVTGAATHLRLPTRKDESMRFDSNGWWEGVDRERRERERAERIMNEKLDAAHQERRKRERAARIEEAGVKEFFCPRCQRELPSADRMCMDCWAELSPKEAPNGAGGYDDGAADGDGAGGAAPDRPSAGTDASGGAE